MTGTSPVMTVRVIRAGAYLGAYGIKSGDGHDAEVAFSTGHARRDLALRGLDAAGEQRGAGIVGKNIDRPSSEMGLCQEGANLLRRAVNGLPVEDMFHQFAIGMGRRRIGHDHAAVGNQAIKRPAEAPRYPFLVDLSA
jgi:hypothetical protein